MSQGWLQTAQEDNEDVLEGFFAWAVKVCNRSTFPKPWVHMPRSTTVLVMCPFCTATDAAEPPQVRAWCHTTRNEAGGRTMPRAYEDL